MRTKPSLSSTLLLLCCLLLASAAGADTPAPRSGIDRSLFDTSLAPGDDLFRYANGSWIEHNPIPPDQVAWGIDEELHEKTLARLREIVDSLVNEKAPLSGDPQKVRDFYATATDEAKLQAQGAMPLREELARVAGAKSPNGLVVLIAHFNAIDIDAPFSFGIDQDERISTRYAVHLSQAGIGLPERDYYLADDEDSKRIREQYRDHVTKMLQLLGDAPDVAAKDADAVLSIETSLARASRTPVQNRDVEALYNKKTLPQLKELMPGFNWDAYLADLGAPKFDDVIVAQPEFFQAVDHLLASAPLEQWRAYFRWHLIHSTAEYLGDPFVNEDFRFYGTVMTGAKELRPRWKRALRNVDRLLGQPLGKLYVQKYFPPEAKRQVAVMVSHIIDAYRQRIRTRDWMSPQTKEKAVAKLATVMPKLGYPDKWRDYSALKIATDSYVQNALRARSFEFHYWLAKLTEPVDRTEWGMTPPTINAYYNPSLNEIVFPAGILQAPYFDPAIDEAANYGSIGATIGHELTHGFDDQGCLFDAQGNMANWWTPEDKSRFDARAARLVEQFNACVAVDDVHVNGKLTLGENIADLGGLVIAYEAYHASLGGKPAAVLDGFTADQRFFLAYAQSWRTVNRPERLRVRARVDPHAPEPFRVNVPVSNVQPFYDALGVKPGQGMYRPQEKRVEVW
jgi:putative endopeptidase